MQTYHQTNTPRAEIKMSAGRLLIACALFASSSYAIADTTLPDVKSLSAQCKTTLSTLQTNGPGSVLLAARKGELICVAAGGLANIELGVIMKPDQKFRIGSVTKQFTAAALLKLIDQGKAKLDDPLSNFISDFPNGGQISLLQLLNHTAGIKDLTNTPRFAETTQRMDLSTKDLIKIISALPADFAPGTAWRYSNSGYLLLSAVIEKITEKSWHEALDDLLIKPFALKDTAWENPDQVWLNLVHGYQKNAQAGIAPASPMSMTVPQGAGALISTAHDLWRWNEALHNGQVLSTASYQHMTNPQGAAMKDKYGFGIAYRQVRGHSALWHNGEINGFTADLMYIPESATTIVQLNNVEGQSKPYLMQLAAQVIGDPFVTLTPEQWSADNLQKVQGIYVKNGVTRSIKLKDGKLYSQRQGSKSQELITAGQQRLGFALDPLSWIEIELDAQMKMSALKFYPQGAKQAETWLRQSDLPTDTNAKP